MHQQIRQSDPLTTPLTLSSPPLITLESEQTAPVGIPKKPLDFILPFAVAMNMNGGLMERENLRAVTAELSG